VKRVAVLLAAVALVAGGCIWSSRPARPVTPVTPATGDSALPPPDEFGSVAPTPAALDVVERIVAVPDGVRDCGHVVETAGYPTTIAPSLDFADCLVEAYRSGEPARAAASARDHAGGSFVAVFDVRQPGVVDITAHHVGPDGALDTDTRPCSPPVLDVWLLDSRGGIRDIENAPLCGSS
jgi:hypothetical protein